MDSSRSFRLVLLAIFAILLLFSPVPGIPQYDEPCAKAPIDWRLTRSGGGFASPAGTTGVSLYAVASNR